MVRRIQAGHLRRLCEGPAQAKPNTEYVDSVRAACAPLLELENDHRQNPAHPHGRFGALTRNLGGTTGLAAASNTH